MHPWDIPDICSAAWRALPCFHVVLRLITKLTWLWAWQVENGEEGLLPVGESTRLMEARGREVELAHLDGSPRSLCGRVITAIWDFSERFGAQDDESKRI